MLTRSATTFVIFSGGGSTSEKEQSDEWALLADSGRSVHLPTLVRQLRLRPKAKLLKIFEEVILTMPTYERPKMLRYLTLIEERIGSFDKDRLDYFRQVAAGNEKADIEGPDVFRYLKDAIIKADSS